MTHTSVTILFIVAIVYAYVGFLCLLVLHVAEEKEANLGRTPWWIRILIMSFWLPMFVFGTFYMLLKRRKEA